MNLNRKPLRSALAMLALAVCTAGTAFGQTGAVPPFVLLKPVVPNLPQTGSFYISGKALSGYVGVGRKTPLAISELLGLHGESTSYNGMNIEGPAGSKSYYGYAFGGSINAYTEFDDNLGVWSSIVGGHYLSWNGSYMGVGTKSPNATLDVRNGIFAVTNAAAQRKVEALVTNDGAGQFILDGPNGSWNIYTGTSSSSANYGYLGVCDATGTTQAFMYLDSLGKGNVVADVKNFRVPNPHNEAEDIYYASLEGPEAAAYIRGTGHLVNGKAHVTLPGHFTDVTVSQGMTVQITAKSPDSKGIGYWHGSNTGFDVFELNAGNGSYDFDWEVKCVREGHEDYKPVRAWTDALPLGADRQQMWTARQTSIANQRALATEKPHRP